jgi:large subunit ribosomal protein L24
MKLKIKSGDTVRVITGDHKGEEGKVVTIFNLMLLEDGDVTKVGYRVEGEKKVRFSKKTDKAI